MDVDNFKAINDTHGHPAGDVCIRHVARVMQGNVGEGDWLARWGGDEFVLSMWDASVFASPEAVLGRIQRGPQAEPCACPGREAGVEHQRGCAPLRGRGRPTGTAGKGGRGHVRG